MNQTVSITITKTVSVNGTANTSVISANCAPAEVESTTRQLLATMTQVVTFQAPNQK